MRTEKRFGRTCLITVVAVAACTVACALGVSLSHADNDEVVSTTADMRGDGDPDSTEASPQAGPGEVRIRAASIGGSQGEVVLRGRWPGDRFGESVVILNDFNANGSLDLLVGAPSAGANARGEAYLFLGPFRVPPGEDELLISADDADLVLVSFFDGDYDFGRHVAPLHDFTGTGSQQLRVQSLYTDADGDEFVITQAFDGADGTVAFAVVNDPCLADFWATLPGDALGDQVASEVDLNQVLMNYGLEGEYLTAFDGDLNGDGIVDEVDRDLVLNNLDTIGALVEFGWAATSLPAVPANHVLLLYYDDLSWYMVTPDVIPVIPGHSLAVIDTIEPVLSGPESTLSPDCLGGCIYCALPVVMLNGEGPGGPGWPPSLTPCLVECNDEYDEGDWDWWSCVTGCYCAFPHETTPLQSCGACCDGDQLCEDTCSYWRTHGPNLAGCVSSLSNCKNDCDSQYDDCLPGWLHWGITGGGAGAGGVIALCGSGAAATCAGIGGAVVAVGGGGYAIYQTNKCRRCRDACKDWCGCKYDQCTGDPNANCEWDVECGFTQPHF